MVSISSKNKIVVIKLGLNSKKQADKLADFLHEQAEIWMNRKELQKELNKLDKEESEKFDFV